MEAEKSEAKLFEYYSKTEKYSFFIKTNGKAQEKAFTAYEVSVRRLRSRAELEPQFEDPHGDQVLEVRVEILNFCLKHQIVFRSSVKNFVCEICDSRFLTQNSLKTHLNSLHFGEKKFVCSFCANRFLSKGQLKVHERSHTKEKSFVCNVSSSS